MYANNKTATTETPAAKSHETVSAMIYVIPVSPLPHISLLIQRTEKYTAGRLKSKVNIPIRNASNT